LSKCGIDTRDVGGFKKPEFTGGGRIRDLPGIKPGPKLTGTGIGGRKPFGVMSEAVLLSSFESISLTLIFF